MIRVREMSKSVRTLRTSVGRVTNGVFDGGRAVLGKVTLLKGVKDVGRGTNIMM